MNGSKRTLILGIGSDFGDDQVGLIIARVLAKRLPQCHVRGLRSPLDVCDYVTDVEQLHIVDACRGAGPPGTIGCQNWHSAALEEVRFGGTHDFDLVSALKLADRFVGLPTHVTIWSIEAADEENARPQSMQVPLSPLVAAAAETLMARIVAEVNRPEALPEEPTRHA